MKPSLQLIKATVAATLLFPFLAFAGDTPGHTRKGPSLELGEAIFKFIPAPGFTPIGWEHMVDGPVNWLTVGFDQKKQLDGSIESFRNGLIDINVMGRSPLVLKKIQEELPWTVTYSTKELPKSGVSTITFSPGSLDEPCFGLLYANCTFDVLPSLKKAGFKIKQLCTNHTKLGDPGVYQLSHPEKRTVHLHHWKSEGSGGAIGWVDIQIEPNAEQPCRSL